MQNDKNNRSPLLGAIIGDIAGSRFEHNNYKKKKGYHLITENCRYTDDSVMSIAVAAALMESAPSYETLSECAIRNMQNYGRKYADAGYGGSFYRWIYSEDPKPYGSYGNGAAMRISACGMAAKTPDEVRRLSRIVTEVSHNHPEAIKGAEATAMAIGFALHGASREELRSMITTWYYPLNFTLDGIRKTYYFDVSCQGSVPQALEAFLESMDFEDAIRNAISIGGDSDTIAAICGSVAAAFYGVPEELKAQAMEVLTEDLREVVVQYENHLL